MIEVYIVLGMILVGFSAIFGSIWIMGKNK